MTDKCIDMTDRCIHCDRDVLIPDEYFGYLVQKPIVCEECWETNDEYDELLPTSMWVNRFFI